MVKGKLPTATAVDIMPGINLTGFKTEVQLFFQNT
jgi:hypothetical protein